MPTIDPNLVPSIPPGSLFSRLTTDTSLNIRFLVALDPVYFDTLNRPHADIALRQLIIARTLDQVNLSLGHQALFPFLIQSSVVNGTSSVDIPSAWIWDLHVSLPQKWEDLRLAKIQRISGDNGSIFTGSLRLFFSAREEGSSVEVYLFRTDYDIESVLTYQKSRITILSIGEQPTVIDPGESETVDGFITFRTLDADESEVDAFFTFLAPPVAGTDSDSDGLYDVPAEYEILDSSAGGASDPNDFSLAAISHGTGMLTDSAWNSIPAIDSSIETWVNAFNFPFDFSASRASTSPANKNIPIGLFNEFDIAVPAGDQETGNVSGTQFRVWINRIQRLDADADNIRFFFATYNVTDSAPSLTPIEFARLDLSRTDVGGQVVAIEPITDLFNESDSLFQQGFGRGHVVLSAKWDGTTSEIDDFFDQFITIVSIPPAAVYTSEATRLSSFALSRVPKYIPTIGQSRALVGTTADRTVPLSPDSDNRYVTEQDQGRGNQINFSTSTVLPSAIRNNADIEPIAYYGSLGHRIVHLIVNSASDDLDYDIDILPRLTVLFGRAPQFGDFWWDGTKLKFHNGSTWVSF